MGRVAIVDDSEDALELFEFILRNQNHEFLTYKTGQEFLKEFRPGAFDLVLLDLVMPVMDGFEVFRRVHELDQNVPVVAITALARQPEREKALKAGFCDYWVKPILEIERFRSTVYSHIGKCANPPAGSPDSEDAA
jgi:CheY-like chemotaxis protein